MLNSGRQLVSMDEGWRFQPDAANLGEQGEWQAIGLPSPVNVTVPHTWNVQEGLEDYRGAGWYEYTLSIPEEWQGCRIRIHFEAVYRDAVIWVNGHQSGSHFNSGYTAFEIDLTANIQCGVENRITVKVNNSNSDQALPLGNSFDWADDGGLIRPVKLIVTGQTAIKHIKVSPEVQFGQGDNKATGKLYAEVYLFEPSAAATVEIGIFKDEVSIWHDVRPLPPQTMTWQLSDVQLSPVDLWHFDHPHLYQLQLTLREEEQIEDHIAVNFGFREILVKGHELWLNREPVRLMGVEWMPGSNPVTGMAEKQEDLIAMLERLKEANCVFTRFHWQQGSELLDWCDRNGILVQEEIPHWQQPEEPDHNTFALALSQAKEMITDHSHHPCILAWGMGNELNGQSEITRRYMEQLKQEISELDSQRLINYVSNTIHFQPGTDATGAGDLLMWNDYIGTWHGDLDEHEVIRQIIADYPDKPIVVAEYGLCEPVYEGGDIRRTEILLRKTEIYRQYPQFAALIFFSLNDYRTQMGEDGEGKLKQRVHGSLDIHNRVKPSFAALREISSPLLLAEAPVWREGELEVTLKCRNDIPSYAVQDYYLIVSSADEMVVKQVIPEMQPGDILTMNITVSANPLLEQVLTIYRPNGFSVLEQELNK
ncbi:glycoside hydrolase family 2 protein [Paenibacillus donghaensis]|uniref:glycoside hydrolase family 2 protein n=1 Tax=Paenibacillus donghaensis TaxID=414771 RepID=UPI0012F9DFA8|nr:sugar-binding domain-containing protein [Paenibacillus donghaensis]